jgi:hypothetical protein
MAQKDEQDFYNEVATFVRGEDHDIKSGTIEMIQAEIVKRLIAENPHLAADSRTALARKGFLARWKTERLLPSK